VTIREQIQLMARVKEGYRMRAAAYRRNGDQTYARYLDEVGSDLEHVLETLRRVEEDHRNEERVHERV
jgi:predicted ATPase